MKYKLICMSFDGEYKTESPEFNEIQEAWNYSNDLGSKWFFYPFHFVVSESGKTIKDCPYPLDVFINRRVETVSKIFEVNSTRDDMQNADCETFSFNLVVI